jgi:hypothetical protein
MWKNFMKGRILQRKIEVEEAAEEDFIPIEKKQ